MGRLIDIENIDYVRLEDSLHCLEHHKGDEMECVICAPTVEAIPKAEYETRLKTDMVDMLKELKSEADELEDPKYILETSELPLDVDGTTLPLETYALQCYCRGGEEVIDIIEKKIAGIQTR